MSAKDASKIHRPSAEEIESLGLGADDAPKTDSQSAGDVSGDAGALRAERDQWKDRALRAVADYQNLERRAESQRYAASQAAVSQFVKTLIPIIDDLERTLDAAEQAGESGAVVEGVRLVREKLLKALSDEGIEAIPAAGEPFDPNLHEALLTQPTDAHPPQTVIEEVARGYRMGDRVLRAAKVIVSSVPAGQG